LFADDVKVHGRITHDVHKIVVQEAVCALCNWAKDWELTVSVDMCCLLNIGPNVTDVPISIDGILVPVVSSCQDLRVTVASDLLPSTHVNTNSRPIVPKAHIRANAIHQCFISRDINLPTGIPEMLK